MNSFILNSLFLMAGSSIGNFITALQESMNSWAKGIVMIICAVMVIGGVYQVAKGMMSGGRGGQTNWFMAIGLIIFGTLLIVGSGWEALKNFGKVGSDTLNSFSQGNPDEATYSDGTILYLRSMLPGAILRVKSFLSFL